MFPQHIASVLFSACLIPSIAAAQSLDNLTPKQYTNLTFTSTVDGKQLMYSVYPPANYQKGQKLPILLYMHGTGPRPIWAPEAMALENYPIDQYPFFLVEPYCDTPQTCWTNTGYGTGPAPMSSTPTPGIRMTYELLRYLIGQLGLDSTRVYIHGNSNGGYATWDMLARWPNFFAAALAVCGAGDPAMARIMVDIPVWAWHSTDDPTVPFIGTEYMIDSLLANGGWPKYNYLSGYGHAAWLGMREHQGEVFAWMFSQQRRPLGPPAFVTALHDTTVTEGDTVQLTVEFPGSGFVTWKKNGAAMAGCKDKILPLARIKLSDEGSVYQCIVTNARGAATTSATLHVAPDVTPPRLIYLNPGTPTKLTLIFSEAVDPQSATSIGDYSIDNGASVTAAAIGAFPYIVELTTTPMQEGGTYTLSVSGVKDRAAAPNAIAAGTKVAFVYNERLPGLHFVYYRGWFNAASFLHDYPNYTKDSEGVINNFDIKQQAAIDSFGFRFDGFVQISAAGDYTFYTSSDDGSLLYVDSALIVNNDGNHGIQERSGTVNLTPGYHAIAVYYYQGAYGLGLTVQWEGPGFVKQTIPDGALWHSPGGVATPAVRGSLTQASASSGLSVMRAGTGAAASLRLTMPRAGRVRIDLFDAHGALRRALDLGTVGTGTITVPIEATAGQILFARVRSCGATLTLPLVVGNLSRPQQAP